VHWGTLPWLDARRNAAVDATSGAGDRAAEEGLAVDRVLDHLDPAIIQPGDILIGPLPVNLAAAVCERGERYLHLSLDLPPALR
jgi:CRISPR-associated protein Csx16